MHRDQTRDLGTHPHVAACGRLSGSDRPQHWINCTYGKRLKQSSSFCAQSTGASWRASLPHLDLENLLEALRWLENTTCSCASGTGKSRGEETRQATAFALGSGNEPH